MSIYVGVNPADLHRLRPVLSLFFQQAIGLQTRELPEHNPALQYQVMMLLDEFTALGRIPIIAEAISYLPGYNVRVVLVIQATSQLREVYGTNNAETMLKSLGARIVYAPKDFAEAREISDELGFTTARSHSVSRPRFWSAGTKGSRGATETQSEQRRALLLPQEVKELGPDHAIVFCEGVRPIHCRKIRYFQDRRFLARLLPPPALLARTASRPEPASAPAPMNTVATSEPAQGTSGVVEGSQGVAPEAAEGVRVRDGELRDLERSDPLALEEFAVDFSQITVPTDRPLSEFDARKLADEFLAAIDRS
jgi:type IV secretion system protein VirD4